MTGGGPEVDEDGSPVVVAESLLSPFLWSLGLDSFRLEFEDESFALFEAADEEDGSAICYTRMIQLRNSPYYWRM